VRLPSPNATLLRVRGQGTSADYDLPAAAGAQLWVGREGVWVVERDARDQQGSTSTVVTTRQVTVPSSVAVDWQPGHVVELELDDGSAATMTVRSLANRATRRLIGLTRLSMEDG
jgi:hypothetical protein